VSNLRITIELPGGGKLEAEGAPAVVEKQVQNFLSRARNIAPTAEPKTETAPRNLRSFVLDKGPRTLSQQIAVVLYHAAKYEARGALTKAEIMAQLRLAGLRPPKAAAQALTDAKRHQHYIENAGPRGMWRLSEKGRRFVENELPEGDEP
jgi:hypothetical protein